MRIDKAVRANQRQSSASALQTTSPDRDHCRTCAISSARAAESGARRGNRPVANPIASTAARGSVQLRFYDAAIKAGGWVHARATAPQKPQNCATLRACPSVAQHSHTLMRRARPHHTFAICQPVAIFQVVRGSSRVGADVRHPRPIPLTCPSSSFIVMTAHCSRRGRPSRHHGHVCMCASTAPWSRAQAALTARSVARL